MNAERAKQTLESLGHALGRLKEALADTSGSELARDATIQRFEFVTELFWKTFKQLLALRGVVTGTLRDALKAAYRAGWIDDESAWLGMLEDCNLTSHTYHEATAIEIYQHIRKNFPEMEQRYNFLMGEANN